MRLAPAQHRRREPFRAGSELGLLPLRLQREGEASDHQRDNEKRAGELHVVRGLNGP